jgi:hypothetical protein
MRSGRSWRCRTPPEAIFFDNFAAIGLRRQASLLTRPRAPGHTRALTRLAPYFDAPNGAAPRSIGCSTPT